MGGESRQHKRSLSRSRCPICAALDIFGDKWSLLVLRDIMIFGKSTYGQFLQSPEGIATNILTGRLVRLEEAGLIRKEPDPTDRRKNIYSLSEKGIDLLPMLAEMMLWSVRHNPGVRIPKELVAALEKNKDGTLAHFRNKVLRGESIL